MVRITPTVLIATFIGCAAVGCAHFVEMQAINHFTAALEKGDIDKVKDASSEHFDDVALRRKDSLDAMKILQLHPEEKVTIVKVEDVSDTEKKVVVTTGKIHRKMMYKLVRDQKANKWVVDDVVVRQKHGDVAASKSVTEQMNLLLVVQDFLVAWHDGKRDAVQAVATPTFARLLGELPPSHLTRLTKRVAGDRIKSEEFRPEAQIDGNEAIVKLQRAKGILILSMKRTNKGWRVGDVALESRKDKEGDYLASVRRTATAIRTTVSFLKAYQAQDRAALLKISAPKFYEKCLQFADLKMIPLPSADTLGEKDLVKTQTKGSEYVIKRGSDTVKLSLSSPNEETADAETIVYLVDDVTLFDAKEEKRLSALYTAQAKMHLFANAAIKGSVTLVQKNSSQDLISKVWSHLGSLKLQEILPPEIELEAPVVDAEHGINYHGSVIKINVRQGSRDLTYVMRDWSGDVTVDDILMPVMNRPTSLKETLVALLPIRLLASAIHEASLSTESHERPLGVLRSVTSANFNQVVWSQLNRVPEAAFSVLVHLDAPLSAISDTPSGQTVKFGDERFGANVELVREKDVLRVSRLSLLNGRPDEPFELKQSLRADLMRRGPRTLALDPMSANPIATIPSRTADAESTERGAPDPLAEPRIESSLPKAAHEMR